MRRISALIALLLLPTATAAMAGTFTVTLTNGTSFETRYRPVEAEWDDSIALLSTDRGNPIALLKSEIADVTSSVEASGFGYQVDTTTLFLGWSPLEMEGAEAEGGGGQQNAADFQEPAPSFTVEQFINPTEAGATVAVPADTGF